MEQKKHVKWVMGSPLPPQQPSSNAATTAATGVPVDYVTSANYNQSQNPHFQNNGVISNNPYVVNNNPYVQIEPSYYGSSKDKGPVDTVIKLLGKCGKKLEDGTRKANETASNVWQHLRTSPNLYDTAIGRLAQGTKVLAEGGSDKLFQHLFGSLPGEKLQKAFVCYISTSNGPIIGTLYVSTKRLAFCSDNPISHYNARGVQEWVYYKVVIQLDKLRAVNPSANAKNPTDKYIQVVTADGHEFWFMGFVSYDKALKTMTEALRHGNYF